MLRLSTPPPAIPASPISPARRNKWILRAILGFAALLLIAIAGRPYYGELHRLSKVPVWSVMAMAALYLSTRGFGALVMSRAFGLLGHPVRRVEAFFLLIIQSYVNLLIPRSGMGMPAAYLKLRHGVPIADYGAVQLLPMFLVEMFCVAAAGLLSQVLLAWSFGYRWHWGVTALFTTVATCCAAVTLIRWPERWNRGGRIFSFLTRLSTAYQKLGKRGMLGSALLAHALTMSLRAARISLAFYAIGVTVNVFAASVASLLSDLMIAISITPGAIGFRESAFIYAADLLGTTAELGLSAAILDRLVVGACNIVLAQVGFAVLGGSGSPFSRRA